MKSDDFHPDEVIDAASLIDKYFTSHGIVKWELGNICSRNHADQNKVYENYFGFLKENKKLD